MHQSPSTSEELAKISFHLDPSAWHGLSEESVWARRCGNDAYVIDNIPFYVTGVAVGDKVSVERRGEKLVFVDVVGRSGHSTYRVLMLRKGSTIDDFIKRWPDFEKLGCAYEGNGAGLFALDVPKESDIEEVYRLLEDEAEAGIWDFEEAYFHGDRG